uniref:Uncharacterized protein n=1 Tax=Sphaerodactylus townsendi TaxID=933632 RepID=A0ACB8E627_9SAUR
MSDPKAGRGPAMPKMIHNIWFRGHQEGAGNQTPGGNKYKYNLCIAPSNVQDTLWTLPFYNPILSYKASRLLLSMPNQLGIDQPHNYGTDSLHRCAWLPSSQDITAGVRFELENSCFVDQTLADLSGPSWADLIRP